MLIKREDAIEAVWNILNGMGISQKHNEKLVEEVDAVFDEIPAADVHEVKARWSDVHVDFSDDKDLQIASMFCDNCHRWHNEVYHYGNPIEFAHYCPNCGADMRGDADV